ncbi:hypothetical protein GQ457_12G009440 [Hibiscus cannabinus]
MVKNKRLQKSKKNDKKKDGKGNNVGRRSGGVNGNKHCRGGASSDSCHKPPLEVHHDRLANCSCDLDGFTRCSPGPYCGSGFLQKSTTKMHYSVAEAP